MPIRMEWDTGPKGGHIPAVYCDVCDKRIVDADQGNVVWPKLIRGDREETVNTIYFVHKENCDHVLRPRIESAPDTITLWEDLWVFLLRLANHCFSSTPRADVTPIIALTHAHPKAGTDDERSIDW